MLPGQDDGSGVPGKSGRYSKKSSQACDACRKRKVRCDFDAESGRRRCKTCESQEIDCAFEHVPRQRGPVRGFRKNKRQKTEGDAVDALSPSFQGTPVMQRDSSRDPADVNESSPLPNVLTLGYGSPTDHIATTGLVATTDEDLTRLGWIQHAADRWFILYQPTFPVLEDTAEADLDTIHPLLRSALLLAIYSIVYRSRTPQKVDALLAEQLLTRYNAQHRSIRQKLSDRMTYLQITMLLAIETDQRGYDAANSVHTVGYWLGQATAQAYDLRLHTDHSEDLGSDLQLLGRRLFLILIVMDRWHSVSTSSPPFIADSNARFDIELHFSGITDHLYRLSIIVGHVYAYIMSPQVMTSGGNTPQKGGSSGSLTFAARMLKSEIEDWRAKVDVIWGQSNLLHVAYWHVCILSLLGSTTSKLTEVLELREVAMRLASTLPNSATPYTPLNHHFYTLTTCVLSHLLSFDETREDARKGLTNLKEAVEKHRDLVDEDDSSWDAKLLEVNTLLLQRPDHAASFADRRESFLDSMRRRGYLVSVDQVV